MLCAGGSRGSRAPSSPRAEPAPSARQRRLSKSPPPASLALAGTSKVSIGGGGSPPAAASPPAARQRRFSKSPPPPARATAYVDATPGTPAASPVHEVGTPTPSPTHRSPPAALHIVAPLPATGASAAQPRRRQRSRSPVGQANPDGDSLDQPRKRRRLQPAKDVSRVVADAGTSTVGQRRLKHNAEPRYHGLPSVSLPRLGAHSRQKASRQKASCQKEAKGSRPDLGGLISSSLTSMLGEMRHHHEANLQRLATTGSPRRLSRRRSVSGLF